LYVADSQLAHDFKNPELADSIRVYEVGDGAVCRGGVFARVARGGGGGEVIAVRGGVSAGGEGGGGRQGGVGGLGAGGGRRRARQGVW
ncbi:hypothetical protein RA279_28475, partial [Pseudomonas syringae pv. tagetis]